MNSNYFNETSRGAGARDGEEKSMRQLHQKWMQTWESRVDDALTERAAWAVILAATAMVVLRAFI